MYMYMCSIYTYKYIYINIGICDCMTKMYKTEGLPAFWKGILPPIIVETPKRAVKVSSCLDVQKDVLFYLCIKITLFSFVHLSNINNFSYLAPMHLLHW